MIRVRDTDLKKLNSITKYPSIETFHTLDRGILGAALNGETPVERIVATEKVDGTNTRIICFADGSYLIGSREELLCFRGDLLHLPALGIVDAVRDVAERLCAKGEPDRVVVWFGETFGGSIQSAREYTSSKRASFRIFDVVTFSEAAFLELLGKRAEEISLWREAGGQPFVSDEEIGRRAADSGLDRTPVIWQGQASALPMAHAAMLEFLRAQVPTTRCRLDPGEGKAEGLVLRTADRRWIRKARLEDYERTLKRSKR